MKVAHLKGVQRSGRGLFSEWLVANRGTTAGEVLRSKAGNRDATEFNTLVTMNSINMATTGPSKYAEVA